MNCPSDGSTLLMSERQGIEIDYCPQCRGIWLDRGELDKMLERAKAESSSHGNYAAAPERPGPQGEAPRTGRHHGSDDTGGYGNTGGYGDYDRSRDDNDRRGFGSGSDREYRDDSRRSSARYGGPRPDDRGYDSGRGSDGRQGQRRKKSPFEFLGDIFD